MKAEVRTRQSRAPILIAGFHRSHTSALGKALSAAGYSLGPFLLPAHWSNPNGHFEDSEVVSLHDEILAANKVTWQVDKPGSITLTSAHRAALAGYLQRRAMKGTHVAIKDPRSAHLIKQWLAIEPRLVVLVPLRHPLSCADSLLRRASMFVLLSRPNIDISQHLNFWTNEALAVDMWLTHHEALLQCSESEKSRLLIFGGEQFLRGELRKQARKLLPDIPASSFTEAFVTVGSVVSTLSGEQNSRLAHLKKLIPKLRSLPQPSTSHISKTVDQLWQELCKLVESIPFTGSDASGDSSQAINRSQKTNLATDSLEVETACTEGRWRDVIRLCSPLPPANCSAAIELWKFSLKAYQRLDDIEGWRNCLFSLVDDCRRSNVNAASLFVFNEFVRSLGDADLTSAWSMCLSLGDYPNSDARRDSLVKWWIGPGASTRGAEAFRFLVAHTDFAAEKSAAMSQLCFQAGNPELGWRIVWNDFIQRTTSNELLERLKSALAAIPTGRARISFLHHSLINLKRLVSVASEAP